MNGRDDIYMGHFGVHFSDSCILGSAICGMKPRILPYERRLFAFDNLGMTDIWFVCCHHRKQGTGM